MRLTSRDVVIFEMLLKWKFLISRQVKDLCNFSGVRACDRRLLKLTRDGWLKREKVLHGFPFLYFVTEKTRKEFDLKYKSRAVRAGEISHDIDVIDTAIYLIDKYKLDPRSIVSERELKHQAGYGVPEHFPDFVYEKGGKKFCVEVELSAKSKDLLEKNVVKNYMEDYEQLWYVNMLQPKIMKNLDSLQNSYNGIEVYDILEVREYIEKKQADIKQHGD